MTDDCVQVVKISDFGIAKIRTDPGVMTAETGTYRWMAPEVGNCVVLFWLWNVADYLDA